MKGSIILRAKKRVEVVPVIVDFSDEMLLGESISSAITYAVTYQGVDATPSDLLQSTPVLIGKTVKQLLARGVVGVVYSVIFQATLTSGRILERTTIQAVLVDEMPSGSLYTQFYFTTPPYSIYAIDGLDVTFGNISGQLRFPPRATDGIDASFSPRDTSSLLNILILYSGKAEGIDISFLPRDTSTLINILILYQGKAEGLDILFEPRTSTLINILIVYSNYKPEGLDVSFAPQSGTLI